MNHPKIVRRPAVLELLQISRSNLYSKIENGLFPKPIQLGVRAVFWLSTENEAVLAAMIQGQSQEEIKHLVKTLVEARKQFKAVA
ncbi:Phage transcriptional regulator, AlpA [Oleispira antarctica RB-8]|uniref:Phage transcriptional regulator, AlpA n=1 Tax=Oleispira antarctica RB-8 TaxID=698738 RepID=R4YSU1_OLEAN|nr:Phage transcriptional regulator, AlpA [Oleispira antarctica RB-8]